jgi:hypothetical protein
VDIAASSGAQHYCSDSKDRHASFAQADAIDLSHHGFLFSHA